MLAWFALSFAAAEPETDAVETAALVYVRTDSDHTTVVSPRTRVRVPVGGERNHVDLVYAVDVWTSASVDIRTAATGRVREQRDELVAGGDRTFAWGTAGLSYRFSHEPDYVSNAGSAFVKVEARQKTITVDGRISGGHDVVGRSGDEQFGERIVHGSAYGGYTHILGRNTLAQVSVEGRVQHGFLSSPYRWVSLGRSALCADSFGLCIPEVHPGQRLRLASVARLRRAFGPRWSSGAAYRFYADSWGVLGHTGRLDVRVVAHSNLMLGLEARIHGQSGARFYRPIYGESGAFFTRDRELSTMWNARGGASAEATIPILGATDLRVGALLGGGMYRYPDFVGLDTVGVLEATVSLGVSL